MQKIKHVELNCGNHIFARTISTCDMCLFSVWCFCQLSCLGISWQLRVRGAVALSRGDLLTNSEQGLMAMLVLHSGEQLKSITLQCCFLLSLLNKFHALELKVSTLSGDLFSDKLLLCSISPTIWLFELQYFFIMISLNMFLIHCLVKVRVQECLEEGSID